MSAKYGVPAAAASTGNGGKHNDAHRKAMPCHLPRRRSAQNAPPGARTNWGVRSPDTRWHSKLGHVFSGTELLPSAPMPLGIRYQLLASVPASTTVIEKLGGDRKSVV